MKTCAMLVQESARATFDGRWLAARILPYRTLDDRIEGVVSTFVPKQTRHAREAQ